ncbi:MAG: adenylyltransferase/cytidyltransferase family protein [Planctomycetes bacterium]|nr:adenylyltransferase/cytidyltransferase family protein [Planctomycetota bacterium]
MKVGYTTGVFDLFHIGHLNILNKAKAMCDKLIVAVTTDELMMKYKKREPIVPFVERCEIVKNIKCVDVVIAQETLDKFEVWNKLKFDFLFVGDDWHKSPEWEKRQKQFEEVGVRVIYFPYTKGTSSTLINEILLERRKSLSESIV